MSVLLRVRRAVALVLHVVRSSAFRAEDRAYCAALTDMMRPWQSNQMRVQVALQGAECDTTCERGGEELLERLWEDGILLAAPKRRVTNARKKKRLYYTKGIVEKKSFTTCKSCERKHLPHHLCPWCFPFNKWTIKKDIKPPNRVFK